jgi:hypothetical protein
VVRVTWAQLMHARDQLHARILGAFALTARAAG